MKKIFSIILFAALVFSGYIYSQDVKNEISPASLYQYSGNPYYNPGGDMIFGEILRNHNVDSLITVAQGYGVVWTGNYYVVSNFSLNMVYKIRADWSLIQALPISGGTGTFRNMTMAKGFLWGVSAGASIFKIDTATMTQVGTIPIAGVQARCLAWDPVRQGFWISTASFSGFMRCYDTLGVAIPNTDIPVANQPGSFYGAAWDGTTPGGPYLWIHSDGVPTGQPVKFTRWNVSSLTNPPTRVDSIRVPIPLMTGSLGGGLAFTTSLIPGKATLIGLSQGTPDRVVVVETATLTGINNNQIPSRFNLEQNYPNPFNPSTRINYDIPKAGNIKLVVTDVLGREVAVLVNGFKPAGSFNATFDASNLSTGIYFYTLSTNDYKETKKMLLIK